MMSAVVSNPGHPEYGVATIPFPIPRDQYAHCMELLAALEIGDAVKADCKVVEFDSAYNVLKRMEQCTVNVEEVNYLAKRLDSFDTGEAAQFQALAHKLELFELKDLINLSFCCQQATVITDFSDLAAVGRNHYMNLHGGCAKTEELNALDGEETARRLIENGGGTITPYGVVYDNGMKLEPVYQDTQLVDRNDDADDAVLYRIIIAQPAASRGKSRKSNKHKLCFVNAFYLRLLTFHEHDEPCHHQYNAGANRRTEI